MLSILKSRTVGQNMVFMSARELIKELHRGTDAERQLCLPEPQDSAGFSEAALELDK